MYSYYFMTYWKAINGQTRIATEQEIINEKYIFSKHNRETGIT